MGKKPLPDFRAARMEAGAVLSKNSNRLKLMEGIILCLMPILMSVILSDLFANVIKLTVQTEAARFFTGVGVRCFFALFQLFLTLPLAVGLLGMAERMARGESVSLTELFEPFGNRQSYRRALGLSVYPFAITVLMVLTVQWTSNIFRAIGTVGFAFLGAVLIVAEVILWLWFLFRGFLAVSLACLRGMSAADAWWKTECSAGYARRGGTTWLVCFLPWILLGLLTVGILLLADVLPRMCVSYFLYTDKMIISSEESNHE